VEQWKEEVGMETTVPQQNNLIQVSVGDEENGYLVSDFVADQSQERTDHQK
jgi:hypothetical protein